MKNQKARNSLFYRKERRIRRKERKTKGQKDRSELQKQNQILDGRKRNLSHQKEEKNPEGKIFKEKSQEEKEYQKMR